MKVRGLALIDKRTLAARHLIEWQADLLTALGGRDHVSPQQIALVEDAARSKLILDHIDATLLEQKSLILRKGRRLMPLVGDRLKVADHLMRILVQLGLECKAPKIKTLDEHLKTTYTQEDPHA